MIFTNKKKKKKGKLKVHESRSHNVAWKIFSILLVLRPLLISYVTQTLSVSLGIQGVKRAHEDSVTLILQSDPGQ